MSRRVYWVRWSKRFSTWYVAMTEGEMACSSKADAVATARRMARGLSTANGQRAPAQLRICGKNGRIQREHTYGADPRRHRG